MEPKEAFPYKPPSQDILDKYRVIIEYDGRLPTRRVKRIFDIIVSVFFLIFVIPILLFLKICYFIEGLIIRENSGNLLFFYWAISGGQLIKKWKLRIIKNSYIDVELSKKNDWLAYAAEWNDSSKTIMGGIVKSYYLDELPQFWSVLIGDMSIVGPRPLAQIHYERDVMQGNVIRGKLIGGILGLGHINKGTDEMGNPLYEYQYADHYLNASAWKLLKLDLWIIVKGIRVVMKGGGF